MTDQRQCTDCHQSFTPEGSAIVCPSCVQDRIDDQMFQDDEDCGQCDGSGYTYDCIDGCCANPEDGCRLCERRCDFCNPFKPTPQQAEERAKLAEIMSAAFSKQLQHPPAEILPGDTGNARAAPAMTGNLPVAGAPTNSNAKKP